MKQTAAYYRLMQDYRALTKEPVEFITAHPNEDDVLEWFYVIDGPPETPYYGGQYFGVLQFPTDYPFNPPAIKMYTPSGRFETNKPLCLTISNYHPETWSPSWSVATILLGLQSFMVSEEVTAGALSTSDDNLRQYAQKSREWNGNSKIFIEQFPEMLEGYAKREF